MRFGVGSLDLIPDCRPRVRPRAGAAAASEDDAAAPLPLPGPMMRPGKLPAQGQTSQYLDQLPPGDVRPCRFASGRRSLKVVEEVEVGPEAVLLLQVLTFETTAEPTVTPTVDTSKWHLIDAMRGRTWCGLKLAYAGRRELWSETPADERCEMCLLRLRHPY